MTVYVIDTNVILLAGTFIGDVPHEQLTCFKKCIEFLNGITKKEEGVLLDSSGVILKEYRNVFTINSYPNYATMFYEYALQNSIYLQVKLIGENMYEIYPDDEKLRRFDPSDRIFIALAYSYPGKAPIVEATDSKWWGIKDNLIKNGIEIIYVDEEYIEKKYAHKIENKHT